MSLTKSSSTYIELIREPGRLGCFAAATSVSSSELMSKPFSRVLRITGPEASGHYHNEQAAGDYETAAQKDPVVRDLIEKNEGNYLRHYEEDRNVDSHHTVEIETTFVDHETVREQS
jgi:hypothetical protein